MGCQKMLLPWRDTTVIGHLISVWRGLGAGQITAVCDARNEPVHHELERLAFPKENRILNPHPETGMFGSIQCAARWPCWREDLSHWIILLGDQPHLRGETLQSLIHRAGLEPHRIWQPARQGIPRHPVILPKPIFLELAGAIGPTFKDFLHERSNCRNLIESDDPGLDFDLDTPADYEKVRRLSAE